MAPEEEDRARAGISGPSVFHTLAHECQKHLAGRGYGIAAVLVAAFRSISSFLKAHHSPGWGVHKEMEVIDGREAVQRGGEGRGRGKHRNKDKLKEGAHSRGREEQKKGNVQGGGHTNLLPLVREVGARRSP